MINGSNILYDRVVYVCVETKQQGAKHKTENEFVILGQVPWGVAQECIDVEGTGPIRTAVQTKLVQIDRARERESSGLRQVVSPIEARTEDDSEVWFYEQMVDLKALSVER